MEPGKIRAAANAAHLVWRDLDLIIGAESPLLAPASELQRGEEALHGVDGVGSKLAGVRFGLDPAGLEKAIRAQPH
jgi:hypothetical protein